MGRLNEEAGGPCREAVADALCGGDWRELVSLLDYEPVGVPITSRSASSWGLDGDWISQFDAIEVAAAESGVRILRLEGNVSWQTFRRGAITVARERPASTVIWWWVRSSTVVVALAHRRDRGGWRLRTLETSTDHPDRSSIEQWTRLSRHAVVDEEATDRSAAMANHVAGVLEEDGLTREFFEGFASALERLRTEMECGPEEEHRRHDIALSTLLRCLFLYFLQARDWLDEDRRYVVRHLKRCERDGSSFYRSVLKPLFFGALNREPGERTMKADALGELPFLNGGLFEPLPVEREYDELNWPNAVWSDIVEGLLERYHFTVEPVHGEDGRRAVDPEMLGKVFEGLMYGESRKSSGSYYTPRDVVRRLVIDAMAGYLHDETNLPVSRLRDWLGGLDSEQTVRWSSAETDRIRAGLREMRLLDPAVGTGAFLLEAFHVLSRAYDRLDPVGGNDFERAVNIIHTHLFGVDIQQTAVRICELRLWLALLPDLTDRSIGALPALPNLGHRIGCGDSLVTPPGRPSAAVSAFQLADADVVRGDIRMLQREYFRAHGARKVELYRRLQGAIREYQREMLERHRDRLEERLRPFENLSESKNLFGDDVELSRAQSEEREQIEEELEKTERALEDLEEGRVSRAGFDFEAHFGPSLTSRGFNVIATNPPWVRTRRIDADQRRHIKETYRCFRNDLWDGAAAAGIRAPFGLQVDLSSVFIERSLNLLAPGGRLSVLMPAKGLRSLHGCGLRRLLDDHQITRVIDYSEADESMFDATVYPAVLELKECRSGAGGSGECAELEVLGEETAEIGIWRGAECETAQRHPRELRIVSDDPAAPWVIAPDKILDGLRDLVSESVSLGEISGLPVQRGVMTGKNDAFIDGRDGWKARFGSELTEQWTRPVIGGRDIDETGVSASRRILWCLNEDRNCREEIPDAIESYFRSRREALQGRADYRDDRPLWQLFRTNEGLDSPKVVWRDLSPVLQAAVAPGEVVPLNTVYFVPCRDNSRALALVDWFHSLPVRVLMRAMAERARGGWRRHFAWVMRMTPLPSGLARWLSGEIDDSSLCSSERQFVQLAGERTRVANHRRRELVESIAGWSGPTAHAALDWFCASLESDELPEAFCSESSVKLTA